MEEENSNSKLQKDESSDHLSEDEAGEEDPENPEGSDSKLAAGDKMISINLLDYRKLSKIKKDFKLNEEGLLKPQFINIMLYHLPEIKDKVGLVNSLNELFAEIDVNDDKHLEWDEFSNYIIEIGLVRKEQGFVDVIKNYKQSEWRDTVKHDNDIECVNFFPHLKQLIVMERDNKRFKLYNSKTNRFDREIKGHTGAVISSLHVTKHKLVATSANDLSIILWDESSYAFCQKISTPFIPMVLACFEDFLYAGGPEGMVCYWDLSETQGRQPATNVLPRHKDHHHGSKAVTAMITIAKLDILVTSDLSGQILLWDIPSHLPNKKMDKQPKGIYSLDWSSEVGCLFSAGLDRAAYVWNPYVTNHIYKLSGHIHSLVGVKCIPDSHQLVTADISGMFKIWDIRTFTCIQSFNAPVAELNSFTVTYPEKKIIAGAKRLYQYTYEEPKDQNKVDEGLPLMCLYNSLYNTFITAHPTCIKIWNSCTGRLARVFRNLTANDVTAIQQDNKKRKLFIGDAKGRVVTFKVKNGVQIKKFRKHAGEVTSLLFLEESKYLVSSAWDRRVKVHDDSQGGEKGAIRFDQIKHGDIVNHVDLKVDLKDKEKYLASCSDDGTILITNLHTLRQETELQGHEGEVKVVKFLNPYHCLVSTDLAGYFYFWAVTPSHLRNTVILKVPHQVSNDSGRVDNCPVRTLDWDVPSEVLFAGDDLGNIYAWNLSQILRKLQQYGNKRDETGDDSKYPISFLLTSIIPGSDSSFKKFQQEDMREVAKWKAHDEGITHISIIEGLQMIISCGFDYRVHIWEFSGKKLGTLVVGGDPEWKVKIDTLGRIEVAKKDAALLLEESMSVSYQDVIKKLTVSEKKESESEESEEEDDDKTKSIFAKLDMSFPSKERSAIAEKKNNSARKPEIKSLNVSRIEPKSTRTVPPKRNLSISGRRIVSNK